MPQIINVIKGDMSLIGPRPMVRYGKKFNKKVLKILRIKPGITGYSQAYYRNSITQKEKQDNDIYYINNISFLLDLKIIFKSIQTVLFQKNINMT